MSTLEEICQNWDTLYPFGASSAVPGSGLGIGFVTTDSGNLCRSENWSDSFVMSYMASVSGTFFENGIRWNLKAPCVCLRRPGHSYIMHLDEGTSQRRCYLEIPADLYRFLLRVSPSIDRIDPVIFPDSPCDFFQKAEDLMLRINESSSDEVPSIAAAFCKLIIQTTAFFDHVGIEKGRKLLDNGASLDEAAAASGMSYDVFRRRFKAVYGIPPGKYRTECRIRKSVTLLSQGLSVTDTAESLGFPDVYTFSHSFTSVMHRSPSAYRKGHRM